MNDVNKPVTENHPGGPKSAPAKRSRLGRWREAFGPRLTPLAIFVIAWMLLLAGFRAGLLIASRDQLTDVRGGVFAKCLYVGVRFDAVGLGAAALPLVLAASLAPGVWFARRWFQRLVSAYIALIFACMVLVEMVGAFFFLKYGFRLNWMAVDYLSNPRETLGYIWREYPLAWTLAGILLLVVVGYLAVMRMLRRSVAPVTPVLWRFALAAVLVGLCVLAIRGSLSSRPLRVGTSTISNNMLLNQLTLSNLYSLGTAALRQIHDDFEEDRQRLLPDPDKARQTVVKMLFGPHDTDLKAPGNPLWRRTDTGRPMTDYNVVLIVMESMGGKPVGALGNTPSYTPELDRLCEQGLFFDHMYASGDRTSRGLTAALCGYPDWPDETVLKSSRVHGRMLTLPMFFKERSYKTMFIYGGSPAWDNVKGFFLPGGIDEFTGQEGTDSEVSTGDWGVPDEVTFQRAHERFVKMGKKPFFATVLTITNHEPYDMPSGRVQELPRTSEYNKFLNCYRYSDWAIGEFFRKARTADYFNRTIFVLVADHSQGSNKKHNIDVPGFRIPCVVYAPGIVPARRVPVVCSQTDIPVTVLSLLGGKFDHCFMGRNILDVRDDDGFAFIRRSSSNTALVRGGHAMLLGAEHKLNLCRITDQTLTRIKKPGDSPLKTRLREELLSYYFQAREFYFDVSYHAPGK